MVVLPEPELPAMPIINGVEDVGMRKLYLPFGYNDPRRMT